MLRTRAVRSLLLDVGAVRPPAMEESGPPVDVQHDADRSVVRQAARRALLVVAIDALALSLLFLLRDRGRAFLALERSPDTVFTIGVLVVAAHLGFRLAQYLQLQRIARALDELPADSSGETGPGQRD
jgi:hypothetical protein